MSRGEGMFSFLFFFYYFLLPYANWDIKKKNISPSSMNLYMFQTSKSPSAEFMASVRNLATLAVCPI